MAISLQLKTAGVSPINESFGMPARGMCASSESTRLAVYVAVHLWMKSDNLHGHILSVACTEALQN